MKIGRNDPCPCGSGKKYKKCCMSKDIAAGREHMARTAELQQEVIATPVPPPPLSLVRPDPEELLPEPSMLDDSLWQEFENTAPHDMLSLLKQHLPDEERFDSDLAFEMICVIRDHNSREVFAEAVNALRQQRPDIYMSDRQHYLDWEIGDTLVRNDMEALWPLCDELLETVGHDLDSFEATLKKLSYYGHTARVTAMMTEAIADIGAHQELFDWVADEFSARTMDMTMYMHYEQKPELRADDATLQADLMRIGDVDQERLPAIVDSLTGRSQRQWALADFAFRPPSKKRRADEDPAVQNFSDLLLVFMGTLWRHQGTALAKAVLARSALYDYILGRHAGDIQPADDDDFLGFSPFARPKKAKHKAQYQPMHMLCPDYATLDQQLGRMISILSADFFTAAAFLELIPAWLDFLVDQGLLSAEQSELAFEDVYKLVETIQPLWEKGTGDPNIAIRMAQAWEIQAGT